MTTSNTFQRAILMGLNRTGKHVYPGLESVADRAVRKRQERRARGLASGRSETGYDLNRAGRRLVALADAAQDRALRRSARREEVAA
ncbi:hypothetical protein MTE01_29070 [Microbacterium testaceum]|uniref:Uncharacterized protein n=1 Tax=Microbacterium testaceum TaxID=2033 RepID=A0A4Y3QP95_MICTE|nr:hypothetical protein [Microbacterium testaceum]GEB46962.1 hypothetical protein MTE01_29070 [Microbacterium testaceum]